MKRKTPREKKNLEYIKDHIPFAETVHGFRRSWPRKKARSNRAYRRRVHNLLATLHIRQEEDFTETANPEAVRREPVRKCYVVEPRGQVISRRITRRVEGTAINFFKREYDHIRDRHRFAGFLTSQVGGRTESSRRLALYLHELMDPSQKNISAH